MVTPMILPARLALCIFAIADAIEQMVKSPAWQEVLKQKGWDDAYLPEPAFGEFLKSEQTRVEGVLKSVGLVK